jgi:hypothetical protein
MLANELYSFAWAVSEFNSESAREHEYNSCSNENPRVRGRG